MKTNSPDLLAINAAISAAVADRKNAATRLQSIALYCAIHNVRPRAIGAACDKFSAMFANLRDMGFTAGLETINGVSESVSADTVTG